jgi:hypothetical protein
MKKISFLSLLVLAACSSQPGPKDVVFDFIAAVRTGDTTSVLQMLDIDAYVKFNMVEMSPEDSAVALREYRDLPVQRLFGDGEVRERWMNWQIVVNRELKQDSLADVEVSFVNRMTRHQILTYVKLQLQPDGVWKIYYFE